MKTHNAQNVRIKREYFSYLKEAMRQSEQSVDAVAKSLARFEEYTTYRDFKTFRQEQAVAFKNKLALQTGQSGERLSKSTIHATLSNLRRFFHWLAGQPGYKSRLQYSDAEFFNLSEKDTRIATARRESRVPTLEQVKHVIAQMPTGSDIERRNKAVVAFTLLTGARDRAIASMRIKHLDTVANCVYQDGREVQTKFSKTFTTYFFPVGEEIQAIVKDWADYLIQQKLWGWMTRCFRQRSLCAARLVSSKQRGLIENSGAMPRRSGRSSGKPSRTPACPTTTRTAFGIC
jgi:integrase